MIRRFLLVWAVLGLVAGLPAAAAAQSAAPQAAQMTDQDKADLARIEKYLNDLKTLQSRFVQMSTSGGFAEGDLYLARPGHMRIEYDPPVPVLIVADGNWLIYFDKELEQVSYLGLNATPAGVLLRAEVSLTDGYTITRFVREPGTLRVGLVQTDDPLAGEVTLTFSDKPLGLKKWVVVDAQGTMTTVALLGARSGLALDPKLFEFDDPTRDQPLDRE